MDTTTRSYDIYATKSRNNLGLLEVGASPTNCFFGSFALWTRDGGFEDRQVFIGTSSLLAVPADREPIWPDDERFESVSVLASKAVSYAA